MDSKGLKNTLFWGFALWLFGYILGFVFFFLVPPALLGWAIMPFGTLAAIAVLAWKVSRNSLTDYAEVSAIWTVMAMALDYVFLVKLLNPADGYYKLDVFAYYALTFILPLAVGYWKLGRK